MERTRTDAADTAARIRQLGNTARSLFIDREEAVTAIELCLVAGEHAILLGPPGTAKSQLIRHFAKGMGLGFFRILLNPDTKREDLVGPIDPVAIRDGRWDRRWTGLASKQIVFLDEIGKASSQVQNMVLDAMEERMVTGAGQDYGIPLHSLFSASNESLPEEQEAIWDRFTVRVVVGYLKNAFDFSRLLTESHGGVSDGAFGVTEEELKHLRYICREMAALASQGVVETLTKLWSNLPSITGERVSDRRWKRVMVLAAANALLDNRTEIESSDLVVAVNMLWQRIDEIAVVSEFVREIVDAELGDFKAAVRLADEVESQSIAANTLEEKARASFKADKLLREIGSRTGKRDWDGIRGKLLEAKERALQ